MRKAFCLSLLLAIMTLPGYADSVILMENGQPLMVQTPTGTMSVSKKVVTTTTIMMNGQPVITERTEWIAPDGRSTITERTVVSPTMTVVPVVTPVMISPVPGMPLTTQSSTTTTTTRETSSSSSNLPLSVVAGPVFYYPPYQSALDQPVRLSYAGTGVQSVRVNVTDLNTGRARTYQLMPVAGTSRFEANIPTADFARGDRLQITYLPMDAQGNGLTASTSQVITYETLQAPGTYQAEVFDTTPDLLIVPFQEKMASSPSFNVYWPELYYAKKPPYPLAARVSSSRAPQNSVRKLDPIAGRPGWFQFQVPSLWYEPGETITVDFTTETMQAFNRDSDYPLDANTQFIPVDTVKFQTMAKQ